MRVIGLMENSMGEGLIDGQMDRSIRVIGWTGFLKAKEL